MTQGKKKLTLSQGKKKLTLSQTNNNLTRKENKAESFQSVSLTANVKSSLNQFNVSAAALTIMSDVSLDSL